MIYGFSIDLQLFYRKSFLLMRDFDKASGQNVARSASKLKEDWVFSRCGRRFVGLMF